MAYPEESGVILPVPSRGIKHVRCQDAVDDPYDIATVLSAASFSSTPEPHALLEIPAQNNSLDLKFARRQLADQRVAHRSHGQLVDQRPDNHDAASGD